MKRAPAAVRSDEVDSGQIIESAVAVLVLDLQDHPDGRVILDEATAFIGESPNLRARLVRLEAQEPPGPRAFALEALLAHLDGMSPL